MNKVLKRLLIIVIIGLMILGSGFYIWTLIGYSPMSSALDDMISNSEVKVLSGKNIVFFPTGEVKPVGIIFYPGGKVAPEAYAPMLMKLAKNGYEVIEVKMPMNLAVFDMNAASKILKDRTDKDWIIAGHSLGGAMAASYVKHYPSSRLKGLLLWASYPSGEKYSLRDAQIPVASIYGSKDMGIDKLLENKVFLPENTKYYEVEGGNHAQFGDYGPQKGDSIPDIDRDTQQELILKSSLEFLNQITE
ncbi:alpha/beta hydrolase [Fusibacter sp. 3D3]|uniref:alpha/beta hydrolase n=1 Tax=Fusibacter sp. 3D3 TaxID=1048380 RepID=UPI000858B8A2|nr:alpha/beta hydrolase [Fusibacter sp. 3D3]GAU76387.1 carboxymethylenebutenolidase-related protein [Fusibacter sp. 3D3]